MDCSIVVRAYTECTLCKHLAVFDSSLSTLLLQDIEQYAVFSLARNDNHVLEVFGTCTNQRDTANIDFLDDISIASTASYSLLKRIQVYDDEID